VNQGETIYSPSLKVKDGKVKIPDGPGWGMKINPAWLAKASYQKSEQQKRH
jgi:L-alanine-DL-glutamate epimerase-like enolase superfamily enzyme